MYERKGGENMETFITTVIIGVIIAILGIVNMTGNISSLHSYHRHRVSEEDRPAFGKLVGTGTLIIGISLIIFGILSLFFEKSGTPLLTVIGTAELIVGILVGIAISFYAMFKYNKGIF